MNILSIFSTPSQGKRILTLFTYFLFYPSPLRFLPLLNSLGAAVRQKRETRERLGLNGVGEGFQNAFSWSFGRGQYERSSGVRSWWETKEKDFYKYCHGLYITFVIFKKHQWKKVMCWISSICLSKFRLYPFLTGSLFHKADLIWIDLYIFEDNRPDILKNSLNLDFSDISWLNSIYRFWAKIP